MESIELDRIREKINWFSFKKENDNILIQFDKAINKYNYLNIKGNYNKYKSYLINSYDDLLVINSEYDNNNDYNYIDMLARTFMKICNCDITDMFYVSKKYSEPIPNISFKVILNNKKDKDIIYAYVKFNEPIKVKTGMRKGLNHVISSNFAIYIDEYVKLYSYTDNLKNGTCIFSEDGISTLFVNIHNVFDMLYLLLINIESDNSENEIIISDDSSILIEL